MDYFVLEQLETVLTAPCYIACKANTIQVSVSISLYSAFHSSTDFKEPDSFIPERWLSGPESSEFVSDQKDAFRPFSYGPRNCLGQQ